MGLFEAAAFAFERSKKGCHFFLPCSLVVHFKPIMVVVYIYIYAVARSFGNTFKNHNLGIFSICRILHIVIVSSTAVIIRISFPYSLNDLMNSNRINFIVSFPGYSQHAAFASSSKPLELYTGPALFFAWVTTFLLRLGCL